MDRKKPSAIAKVPQEWVEQLETIAKQTGQSVNDLVREAIAQYLGVEKFSFSTPPDWERLNAELTTYKTQLEELNQKIDDLSTYSQLVTTLQMRLTALEGRVIQNNQDEAIVTSSPELDINEDDYDDEPDEILFDFLPRRE